MTSFTLDKRATRERRKARLISPHAFQRNNEATSDACSMCGRREFFNDGKPTHHV